MNTDFDHEQYDQAPSTNELIPPGTYQARCIEAQWSQAQSGNYFVHASFLVEVGPYAGRGAVWRGVVTDKTSQRVIKSLRSLGCTCEDLTTLEGHDANVVPITIEIDEYNGRRTNKVGFVGELGPKPIDDMGAFKSRMQALMGTPRKGVL